MIIILAVFGTHCVENIFQQYIKRKMKNDNVLFFSMSATPNVAQLNEKPTTLHGTVTSCDVANFHHPMLHENKFYKIYLFIHHLLVYSSQLLDQG